LLTTLAVAGTVLAALNTVLIIVLLTRKGGSGVIEQSIGNIGRLLMDELRGARTESAGAAKSTREELRGAFEQFKGDVSGRIGAETLMQKNQLDSFAQQLVQMTQLNEQRMSAMRETLEKGLKELRDDNSQKLEQMRATVDEKLNATLEQRLGESFKLVSERLEMVHKGLGEMQTLATGVGDLKKVLTNVKTRGTWGEVQLGNLLEQILAPEQYALNVVTKKGTSERVEFAIRLPGKESDEPVFLPVDSKFPQEDYHRLLDAQERADLPAIEEAAAALERRVKDEARDIFEKYVDPPHTTDFGIMFLPVEGLYAEVLRRPGLVEYLQQRYRVNVTGPTTFAALLNALQMGFRTLAIEKRSSEVWALLGAVKTEFGRFGEVLEKTKKKLQEATNTMDAASTRTRQITRKLKDVEALPALDATQLLGAASAAAAEDEEE
jgi:DNA recombination protein RmuC